jgi:hypothetical protein
LFLRRLVIVQYSFEQYGLPVAVKERPEAWPFVILFPQKPTARIRWRDSLFFFFFFSDLLLLLLVMSHASLALFFFSNSVKRISER